YLVNPDLALPEAAERFVATGKLRASDEVDWDEARVLHTGSLFEMGVPLDRLLPPAARTGGVPWAVTFHDLIPLLMPESYLEDPGRARRSCSTSGASTGGRTWSRSWTPGAASTPGSGVATRWSCRPFPIRWNGTICSTGPGNWGSPTGCVSPDSSPTTCCSSSIR